MALQKPVLKQATSLDRSLGSTGSFAAKKEKALNNVKIDDKGNKDGLKKGTSKCDVNVDIGCVTQEGLYHKNEDRMCYGVNLNDNIHGYVGVFDGHGGEECASYVANNLARYLVANFERVEDWKAGDNRMKTMFHKIEDEFVAIATEIEDTSGACATVMIVKGTEALIANIGDCKAIAIPESTADDYIILTGDHRADAEEEMERIERAGGSVVEGRVGNLQPSRSFGDIDVKEIVGEGVVIPTPEVSRISMQPGGFMVIATDGLWDYVGDSGVIALAKESLIKHNNDVELVAEDLAEHALKCSSTDDITVSVVLWSLDIGDGEDETKTE